MRIRSITANNFKSLVDFKLDLAKFSCLIGLNGSGKSTVLQFIDFLSQLMRGDLKGWLRKRRWKSTELKSKLRSQDSIDFGVGFSDDDGRPIGEWTGTYSPESLRCVNERLSIQDSSLDANEERATISRPGQIARKLNIEWEYEGSILSSVKEEVLPDSIRNCKRFFLGSESLDMLTPDHLRCRTRSAEGTLGHGGRNLSAFLYELGLDGRKALTNELQTVYPQLRRVGVRTLRSGWKEMQASEAFEFKRIGTMARHLNDGMLRLMAILAEMASDHGFVLFDEVENGINPEVVEFVIDKLVNARQQVLVTTHSPMILNYLDDETARQGVIYLYKTPQGHTKSIPFFSIPSLAKKLTVMGPGEAFVDTNLTKLADEIAGLNGEEA